jgi:hypothetical protein
VHLIQRKMGHAHCLIEGYNPRHRKAGVPHDELFVVLKPNRIIHKRMDANCSSFHLRVFLGLLNPQGQRQTSTLSILHDNFGERKDKFDVGMSRTTQM